jgi:trimethylguanosine synthase
MVAIDAFSGCGGNAIACARERAYVLACDLSPLRLAETQHNAGVYGVAQYLDCVAADWTTLSQAMARHGRLDLAHAVFLSPPWGGPAYAEAGTFDLRTPLAGGQSAKQLLGAALSLAPVAAIFLPKNLRIGDVVQMATDAGAEKATMEQALLNGKLKAVTVYASRGRIQADIFDVLV